MLFLSPLLYLGPIAATNDADLLAADKTKVEKIISELSSQGEQLITDRFDALIELSKKSGTDLNQIRYAATVLKTDFLDIFQGTPKRGEYKFEKQDNIDRAKLIEKIKKIKTQMLELNGQQKALLLKQLSDCRTSTDLKAVKKKSGEFFGRLLETFKRERVIILPEQQTAQASFPAITIPPSVSAPLPVAQATPAVPPRPVAPVQPSGQTRGMAEADIVRSGPMEVVELIPAHRSLSDKRQNEVHRMSNTGSNGATPRDSLNAQEQVHALIAGKLATIKFYKTKQFGTKLVDVNFTVRIRFTPGKTGLEDGDIEISHNYDRIRDSDMIAFIENYKKYVLRTIDIRALNFDETFTYVFDYRY